MTEQLLESVTELVGLMRARVGDPEPLRAKVTIQDIADNAKCSKRTAKRYTEDKKFPLPCKAVKYRVGDVFRETDKRWFADEVDRWFSSQ